MCGDECRHLLFETARQQAGTTVVQLWVRYLALGGVLDLFTVEAYLNGLTPLPPAQQDVLATAVNEQLEAKVQTAKVSYLNTVHVHDPDYPDPLDVLEPLLVRSRRDARRPQAEGS